MLSRSYVALLHVVHYELGTLVHGVHIVYINMVLVCKLCVLNKTKKYVHCNCK